MIVQELSLPFSGRRLGNDALDLALGYVNHYKRREDAVETSDDMAFDDLGGYVRDKCLLLHLFPRGWVSKYKYLPISNGRCNAIRRSDFING